MENLGTIWVCQCCMLNHANGECGCGAYYGEDPDHDPLSLVSNDNITMGMLWSEHDCEPDEQTGEHPDECDCQTKAFSTSRCEGCGSWLHGERHAMTLWRDAPRVVKAPELEDTVTLLRRLYLGS